MSEVQVKQAIQGYVRNCVLILRPNEDATPFCSEDGPVIASLKDYAILPLSLYQEIAQVAAKGMPNLVTMALRGMVLNIEPGQSESFKRAMQAVASVKEVRRKSWDRQKYLFCLDETVKVHWPSGREESWCPENDDRKATDWEIMEDESCKN